MLELRDRPGQQLVEAERCSKVERGELRAERRYVDRRYDGSAGYALVSAQQLAREKVIPPHAFVAWRKEGRDRWHRIVRCGHVASCLTRRVPSYRTRRHYGIQLALGSHSRQPICVETNCDVTPTV